MSGSYKSRRHAYLNCEKAIYAESNRWGFPSIDPVGMDTTGIQMVGFNFALGERHPENKVLHFYVDDYQFERVWNDPDRYIPLLSRFRAVLQPDFSIYEDFPLIVNMINHYRKQWCSAYWREHGITVIPCLCWGDVESFGWCFEGVPQHSLVSISTVGGFTSAQQAESWFAGYRKALEVLRPAEILLYGKKWPGIEADCPITVVGNTNIKRLKQLHRGT